MSSFPARLSVVFLGMTVLVAPFAVMAEDVPPHSQGRQTCRPDNVACMGSALLVGLIAVQRNLGLGLSWLQRTNLWRR